VKNGGIDIIFQAMKYHPKFVGVQEFGCAALQNISADGEFESSLFCFVFFNLQSLFHLVENHKVIIAQKGGIELVLRAMKRHFMYPGVQQYACGVLWNLAANSEFERKTWRVCFSLHLNSQCVCVCFFIFCSVDNKALIAQKGGIQLIIHAMKLHPNHQDVQEKATGALRNLATRNGMPQKECVVSDMNSFIEIQRATDG
jgi:hypothetical protein